MHIIPVPKLDPVNNPWFNFNKYKILLSKPGVPSLVAVKSHFKTIN